MYQQMFNPSPYGLLPMQRGIQYVNGLESAKVYQMGANQEALLMDSAEPVFYLKTTDAAGQYSIKEYEFKERVHPDPRQVELDSINDRLQRLEFLIASMKEGNDESIITEQANKHSKSV